MDRNKSNFQLHKRLAMYLAVALLAGGAISSTAYAAEASGRGKSLPEWARNAPPATAVEADVADDEESVVVDGDIDLPAAISSSAATVDLVAKSRAESGLKAFNATNQTSFKASFDPKSGKATMLYGSQSKKYANGAESVARGFLADTHAILGIQQNLSDLKTLRVDETPEKDHVKFQQTYNGVPVVGAMLIVHSNKGGQVSMVQNGHIDGIQPVNSDIVAEAAAKGIAMDALKGTFNSGTTQPDETIEKQLIQINGKFYYIWKVSVQTQLPFGYWVIHVDADSGKVLYKENEIMSKTGKGRVVTTNANYLLGRTSTVPLKNLYLGGNLYGLYARIFDCLEGNTTCYANTQYSSTYNFSYTPYYNSGDFHSTQAYYAIDTTRDWWLKSVINKYGPAATKDSSNPFTWSTPILTNVYPMCNAYYQPGATPRMVFGSEDSCSGGSADLVMDWDVVRHEYTHAMMDWAGFSGQFGGTVNQYGRSMGEGNADWFGYLRHPKDPRTATVAWDWSTNGYLRTLDNSRMYPWDVNSGSGVPEEHYTGEIWGGYLYDLYRVLGAANALKYMYNSFYYFTPSGGLMSSEPDFYDAIYAGLYAEWDLYGKRTNSFKALGSYTSRGLSAKFRSTYNSYVGAPYSAYYHPSNYFGTLGAGHDNNAYMKYYFPLIKTIATKGNMLLGGDEHEYVVQVVNSSMKLTATVTGSATGLYNPSIGLFNSSGTLVGSATSTNGKSVTYQNLAVPAGEYVIKVTGQTYTAGRGYYGFKFSIL